MYAVRTLRDRKETEMLRTVEAVIEEDGRVRLLESIRLPAARRALITILDETPVPESKPAASSGRPSDAAEAIDVVHRTHGTISLDEKSLRWVAEDKSLEYGASGAP